MLKKIKKTVEDTGKKAALETTYLRAKTSGKPWTHVEEVGQAIVVRTSVSNAEHSLSVISYFVLCQLNRSNVSYQFVTLCQLYRSNVSYQLLAVTYLPGG